MFLTSCQALRIETPWSTQPGVYWNRVSNVNYIASFEKRDNYVKASYPGFDTNFTILEDKVKMNIEYHYYEKPCKVHKQGLVTTAQISDKEFVRIDLTTGITTLKYMGVYRVYLKDHI